MIAHFLFSALFPRRRLIRQRFLLNLLIKQVLVPFPCSELQCTRLPAEELTSL